MLITLVHWVIGILLRTELVLQRWMNWIPVTDWETRLGKLVYEWLSGSGKIKAQIQTLKLSGTQTTSFSSPDFDFLIFKWGRITVPISCSAGKETRSCTQNYRQLWHIEIIQWLSLLLFTFTVIKVSIHKRKITLLRPKPAAGNP